ncbi:protein serine/threonine phosphatase 2C [Testicularia cyperi]|uniref:Protein phosphatase n=1 Tax=Testicularia cyperi TaxID=1882483 RepID=A0A317XV25_9BASI|nr:protein serine/threonine phosphatase 2C [Testicularia cyperi]
MLAAAADFLTGSVSASGPAAQKKKLGGEALIAEDGRRLGLNSPIREHGRIVQDRLESVQVGEDAYFLRSDSLGVADGVGGWASRAGADPALFSRLLMHFCAAELGKFDNLSADQLAADNGKLLKEWERVDPVEVMHTAWERCVRASRREGIMGSSTALIAVLRGDELRIANLGDCVLLIIRAGELLFRSTEQQHSFNFPVQLGMMGYTAESVTLAASRTLARDGFLQSGASDDLDDDAPCPLGTSDPEAMKKAKEAREAAQASNAGNEDADEAEWDEPRRDAGRWAVKVQKGDIIIVGSDGLVDNLFDEDIVEEVLNDGISGTMEAEYQLPEDFCPQLVSEALCSRAKAVSEDSRAVSSPFQQRAMEEGLHYVGGKHDDISVVVAVVGDPSDQLANSGFAVASDQQEAPIASPVSA